MRIQILVKVADHQIAPKIKGIVGFDIFIIMYYEM